MKLSRIIAVTFFGVLVLPLLFVQAQERAKEDKVASLIALLKSTESEVRIKAAQDLGSLGPKAVTAVGDLVDVLEKDQVPDVRIVAANALGAIYFMDRAGPPDKKAIRALIRAMRHDKDTVVRWKCCIVFRVIGPSANDAAPALLDLLMQEDDGHMRVLASQSFGAIVGPECKLLVPKMLEMYKNTDGKDARFDRTLMIGLAKIGDKQDVVIRLLIDALEDPKKMHLRDAAAIGLECFGPKAKAGVPALIDALDISKIDDEERASVTRHFVLRALGSMGPEAKDAIPAIKKIAQTDNNRLSNRRLAQEVLGKIEKK